MWVCREMKALQESEENLHVSELGRDGVNVLFHTERGGGPWDLHPLSLPPSPLMGVVKYADTEYFNLVSY